MFEWGKKISLGRVHTKQISYFTNFPQISIKYKEGE